LIKYAEAGNASARLAQNRFPHIHCRNYEATIGIFDKDKLDEGNAADMLKSTTVFACYNFDWRDNSLLVYVVEGQVTPNSWRRMNYVISIPSPETFKQQNSTVADSLIRAAGVWHERSDNQVWVFDKGNWTKNRQLCLNLQNNSQNDVILPREMRTALNRDLLGFFDARQHYQELNKPWKVGSLTMITSIF
jgi:hypothetical protein